MFGENAASEREHRVHQQVEDEHPAPPEPVGGDREQVGADEHAREPGRDHQRLAERAQIEFRGEHRGEHATEEHLVEVEERAEADQHHQAPVPAGHRKPLQHRRHGRRPDFSHGCVAGWASAPRRPVARTVSSVGGRSATSERNTRYPGRTSQISGLIASASNLPARHGVAEHLLGSGRCGGR